MYILQTNIIRIGCSSIPKENTCFVYHSKTAAIAEAKRLMALEDLRWSTRIQGESNRKIRVKNMDWSRVGNTNWAATELDLFVSITEESARD